MKTLDFINGEPWNIKNATVQNHTCCDCGLTHLMQVDIKKGNIILKFYRNDYKTAQIRKKQKIKIRSKT